MAINETAASYSNAVDTLFQGHSQNTTQKEEDPLGRDAFLTMLVAQMKHQDPLNPLQGTDFTAQLAQYSSLEQQFNTNDLLTDIKSGVSGGTEENLIDYIGKEVVTDSSTLLWKDSRVVGGSYTLDEPGDIVVTIMDPDGNPVRNLYERHSKANTYQVEWDGRDVQGNKLSEGSYQYEVNFLAESGATRPLQTSMSGKVTGVTYEHGSPYLLMGDQLIDPQTVLKVQHNGADT
jgi:flagellar basal-body rod modification protein FlgD